MRYIDTSAFVKYYSEESSERGSDRIKDLINRAREGKDVLISSVLLIAETVSVFDKWVRLRLLPKEDFAELLALFINDLKELVEKGGLVFEGIDSAGVVSSIDYIVKHRLTVNDSLHLYSALLNKDDIEEFICSDNSLGEAAKKEGLQVWNPEE